MPGTEKLPNAIAHTKHLTDTKFVYLAEGKIQTCKLQFIVQYLAMKSRPNEYVVENILFLRGQSCQNKVAQFCTRHLNTPPLRPFLDGSSSAVPQCVR